MYKLTLKRVLRINKVDYSLIGIKHSCKWGTNMTGKHDLGECFSVAAKYINSGPDAKTHKTISSISGMSISSIHDYIGNRRKGTEEKRRKLAKVLNWEYEPLIALGHLILEGHDPDQYEYVGRGGEDFEAFVFANKTNNGTYRKALVVTANEEPPNVMEVTPTSGKKNYPQIVWKYESGVAVMSDVYAANPLDMGAIISNLFKGEDGAVYKVLDDAMAPVIPLGAEVAVQHFQAETQIQIDEGCVYLLYDKECDTVRPRKLARRDGKILVFAVNQASSPPYLTDIENLKIIGKVLRVIIEL